MAKAYDEGFFNDMITPFMGLDKDNNLRRDTTLEKLAKLKPAFDKQTEPLLRVILPHLPMGPIVHIIGK